ncbi:conserved protein of unknown function [Sterolibacterium denitrificans]|uniref:Uncharacterized protein n=1 Tax=Sterolibacterium denitrificans TaxID=157592 RepID=A0A7Z7MV04_9PROT|nr:hypothetical protein [Sterolibacterium denitrificans]SMB24898.1 conserved protein of unknown function [Sterolibacterium denitrificans]
MSNKATAPQYAAPRPTEWTLMYPIFSSHVRRIGWVRTFAGGLPMYLCIPLLIVLHVTTCVAAYQWLLRPLFGIPRVRWADHVIIDRHRIAGMGWFDKFNCMFCGYANGLVTMANMELDHLARVHRSVPLWKQAVAALVVLLLSPLVVIFEAGVQIIYNILVSRPLGMHRVSIAEASRVMTREGYAAQLPWFGRLPLRCTKSIVLRFSMALEQIESSWCPLKHLETREGIVYPKHHDRFFGPHEIERMRQVLSTVGTVSDRRPTW